MTLYDAGGDHTILDVAGTFAVYEVTRQHQTILHETWLLDRQNTDYLCWDYTTQAACDNFITQGDNASAGDVYAVRQDPWIDTCFWSNSHDKVVGVWETTEGSALGTDLCDVIYSTPPTTTTVPPTEESTTTAPDPLVELPQRELMTLQVLCVGDGKQHAWCSGCTYCSRQTSITNCVTLPRA